MYLSSYWRLVACRSAHISRYPIPAPRLCELTLWSKCLPWNRPPSSFITFGALFGPGVKLKSLKALGFIPMVILMIIHTYGHPEASQQAPIQEQGLTRSCWRRASLHTNGQLAFLHQGPFACLPLCIPKHWKRSHMRPTVIMSPSVEREHHWSLCHSLFYVDTKKFQMTYFAWPWLIIPIFLHTLAKVACVVTLDEAEARRELLKTSTHR